MCVSLVQLEALTNPLGALLDDPELYPNGQTMSRYKDILGNTHKLTLSRIARLSPGDLAGIGVPLGDAVDIIEAFSRLPAQSRISPFLE